MGKQPTEDILLSSLAQITTLIESFDDKTREYDIGTLKQTRGIIINRLKAIAWEKYATVKGIKDDI